MSYLKGNAHGLVTLLLPQTSLSASLCVADLLRQSHNSNWSEARLAASRKASQCQAQIGPSTGHIWAFAYGKSAGSLIAYQFRLLMQPCEVRCMHTAP